MFQPFGKGTTKMSCLYQPSPKRGHKIAIFYNSDGLIISARGIRGTFPHSQARSR